MVILDEKSAVERQIILDKLLSMKSVPKVKSTIRTKTPIEQARVESKSKKESVVKYTLPKGNSQIFASKHKTYLPDKNDLKLLYG